MTRKIVICVIFLFVIGCAKEKQTGKITVIATLFPQYDFAKQIAGEKADVHLLLPPGVEPHTFEPTPKDIADISKADIFIYTGKYMEPWAVKLIEAIKSKSLIIIDTSRGIKLLDESEEHRHNDMDEKAGTGHDHSGKDPHIWLDPVNAQKMVDNILAGFIQEDPKNEPFYQANAGAYKNELKKLDMDFTDMFKKTKNKTIIYGGHFAFGYFAKRYGLDYISPYNGFSPDAEPTPKRIAELIKKMKAVGLGTIYYEELIDPKVAKVIADQTGAAMLLLHGAHNISKDELKSGITYISIMRGNMERLKEGLGYKYE